MRNSPDPPDHPEEDFGLSNVNDMIIDFEESENISSEESGDDSTVQSQFDYELLPQDVLPGINIGNDLEIVEDNSESLQLPMTEIILSPDEKVSSQTLKVRSDIEINHEEVKAAMQNITLPPSSIPSWAVSIPESQWTSFLLTRISNLQSSNKS